MTTARLCSATPALALLAAVVLSAPPAATARASYMALLGDSYSSGTGADGQPRHPHAVGGTVRRTLGTCARPAAARQNSARQDSFR